MKWNKQMIKLDGNNVLFFHFTIIIEQKQCFSAPFNVWFKITDFGDLHTGLGSALSQAIYIIADKNDSTLADFVTYEIKTQLLIYWTCFVAKVASAFELATTYFKGKKTLGVINRKTYSLRQANYLKIEIN